MKNKINVLLFAGNEEDRKLIFTAISTQDDMQITGVENDETGAIIKSGRLKPDILIMGLQAHGTDGISLAPIIRRRSPDTAIIMMCDRDESDYAEKALKAGISGFLLKKTDMDKLLSIVRIVKLGGYYISTPIIERSINSFNFLNRLQGRYIIDEKYKPVFFSTIERSIVTELARGFSDKEIAERLNFSVGAVKNRLTAIKRKTKLKNRMEIAVFSLARGLIRLDQPVISGKKE